jgi:hypothetical protein
MQFRFDRKGSERRRYSPSDSTGEENAGIVPRFSVCMWLRAANTQFSPPHAAFPILLVTKVTLPGSELYAVLVVFISGFPLFLRFLRLLFL